MSFRVKNIIDTAIKAQTQLLIDNANAIQNINNEIFTTHKLNANESCICAFDCVICFFEYSIYGEIQNSEIKLEIADETVFTENIENSNINIRPIYLKTLNIPVKKGDLIIVSSNASISTTLHLGLQEVKEDEYINITKTIDLTNLPQSQTIFSNGNISFALDEIFD